MSLPGNEDDKHLEELRTDLEFDLPRGMSVDIREDPSGFKVLVCSEKRRSGAEEEDIWMMTTMFFEQHGFPLLEDGRQGIHEHKHTAQAHAWERWGVFARSELEALAKGTETEGVLSVTERPVTGAEIKVFCAEWPPGRDWVLCDADMGFEVDDKIGWSSSLKDDKLYKLSALGDTEWDGLGDPPDEPPHNGELDVSLWTWFEFWMENP